jgi:hypothetical protein
MEIQHLTLVTAAHNGKVTIRTEIPVSDADGTYVVTIAVSPQCSTQSQALDQLYGALADTPMPEITSDPLPEQRDEM